MKKKAVLMDGAVGTSLWEKTGDRGPVWRYNLENPGIVRQLHGEMLEAGAQIILANTFGANGGAVKRSSEYAADAVVRAGMRICRETVGDKAKKALSIGPLLGLMEPYGDITGEEAAVLYSEMIDAGVDEGADIIYLQTFIDLSMMKVAAGCARKHDLPLFCSMSFEKVGKTIMGNSVEDMVAGLAPYGPEAVGLNCSLGPVLALPVLKMFLESTELPVIFKPNAGKPILLDNGSVTEYDAGTFAGEVVLAARDGASYVGGCCGANAEYIKKLGERLADENIDPEL